MRTAVATSRPTRNLFKRQTLRRGAWFDARSAIQKAFVRDAVPAPLVKTPEPLVCVATDVDKPLARGIQIVARRSPTFDSTTPRLFCAACAFRLFGATCLVSPNRRLRSLRTPAGIARPSSTSAEVGSTRFSRPRIAILSLFCALFASRPQLRTPSKTSPNVDFHFEGCAFGSSFCARDVGSLIRSRPKTPPRLANISS